VRVIFAIKSGDRERRRREKGEEGDEKRMCAKEKEG